MTYKKGEIVVVPFPFADISRAKFRPALIISKSKFNTDHDHSILAMITSASNKTNWPSDTNIKDLQGTGLPKESVIRLKIFTIDNRLIQKQIGKLSKKDQANFNKQFASAI